MKLLDVLENDGYDTEFFAHRPLLECGAFVSTVEIGVS